MMDERREGAPGTGIKDMAAPEAPARARRMKAKRKSEAVLRMLRGQPPKTVSREVGFTVGDLIGWLDAFLGGPQPWRQWRRVSSPNSAASRKSRPRNDRYARIAQFQAKRGKMTIDYDRLRERFERMDEGPPLFAAEFEAMCTVPSISVKRRSELARVCWMWSVPLAVMYRWREAANLPMPPRGVIHRCERRL